MQEKLNEIQKSTLLVRTKHCLENQGIETIEDLIQFRPEQILAMRNLGKGGLKDIQEFLIEKGLHLKGGEPLCIVKKQELKLMLEQVHTFENILKDQFIIMKRLIKCIMKDLGKGYEEF